MTAVEKINMVLAGFQDAFKKIAYYMEVLEGILEKYFNFADDAED